MDQSSLIKILFITIFAEVIGIGILLPIAPLLFTEPSSQFFMLEKGQVTLGYILLGLLVGLYPLTQFFSTPILGELSDIYGRKRVMQLSIIGTVISTVIFAQGIILNSIPILLLSRIFNGATGGLISVAQASIADVSSKKDKSKNFGIIGAAFGTGFIFGPFLGGVLSSDILPFLSPTTPFYFAALVSTASLVYLSLEFKETSPREKTSINWAKPLSQLKKGLNLPGLRKIFGANFFYFSGFAFFTTFLPVYLIKKFGLSQFHVGNFYLYLGILILFGQTVVVPRLFSRYRESRVMPLTMFLTGVFIVSFYIPESLILLLALVPFYALNNSITIVSLQTLVSNNASEKDQGLALGTNQSLRSIGNAFPSMLSGFAAALSNPGIPLVLAGLLMAGTAVSYRLIMND